MKEKKEHESMQNFTTQHSDYSHTLFYKIGDILFLWPPFFIVKVEALVAQLCPTLCNPMDCSSIGFSVHGSPQARILEWVPSPSPGDLLDPGIKPVSLALQADSLPSEPPFFIIEPKYLSLS